MTGFTRVAGQHGSFGWTWEIRSVNGKGLDLRVRLPSGYESLEAVIRDTAAKFLRRGSIAVSLVLERANGEAALRINREFLDRLLALSAELAGDKRVSPEPPRLETLLDVRGVVEAVEADDDPAELEARLKAMAESLEGALQALAGVREAEGARLAEILRQRLEEMASLRVAAESTMSTRNDAIRERLRTQLDALLEMRPALSEERLAQEAALLAVKADIREELDRLGAHIEAARALLGEDGAIGRKLDFLCQEFNRETNTLCSKSGDIELTRIGLDLKSAIDQFREQALNVE
jgi:uncharacterized protein (TIGR00255 family)